MWDTPTKCDKEGLIIRVSIFPSLQWAIKAHLQESSFYSFRHIHINVRYTQFFSSRSPMTPQVRSK